MGIIKIYFDSMYRMRLDMGVHRTDTQRSLNNGCLGYCLLCWRRSFVLWINETFEGGKARMKEPETFGDFLWILFWIILIGIICSFL